LVSEEHGVQAELGVDQRHVAEPVGEGVYALLPLTEVLWVGPGSALRTLAGETGQSHSASRPAPVSDQEQAVPTCGPGSSLYCFL